MKIVSFDKYDWFTQDLELVAYLRVVCNKEIRVWFIQTLGADGYGIAILCRSKVYLDTLKKEILKFRMGMIVVPDYREFLYEIKLVQEYFINSKALVSKNLGTL